MSETLASASGKSGTNRSGGGQSRQAPVEGLLTIVGICLHALSTQSEIDPGVLPAGVSSRCLWESGPLCAMIILVSPSFLSDMGIGGDIATLLV